MNPRSQDSYTQAYNKWVTDQSPENMADLVSAFMPTINSEIQQYSGQKNLLRARAKSFVVNAIRTFDPMGKTKLNSWVVTNLKQLSRYGKRLRPIRVSEDIIRNSAELNRVSADLEDRLGRKPTDDELQDETGWSIKTINKLRESSIPTVVGGEQERDVEEGGPVDPSVQKIDTTQFLRDSVYMSLDDRDKLIYDYKLGDHGRDRLSGADIARKLNVTPAFISQRASSIGNLISDLGSRQ